jgi:hypothetical protein
MLSATAFAGLMGYLLSNPQSIRHCNPSTASSSSLSRYAQDGSLSIVQSLPRKISKPIEALLLPGTAAASADGTSSSGGLSPAMQMMKQLLPLTDMQNLTTAQLLDAAAAGGLGHKEIKQLMKMHQEDYCRYVWIRDCAIA